MCVRKFYINRNPSKLGNPRFPEPVYTALERSLTDSWNDGAPDFPLSARSIHQTPPIRQPPQSTYQLILLITTNIPVKAKGSTGEYTEGGSCREMWRGVDPRDFFGRPRYLSCTDVCWLPVSPPMQEKLNVSGRSVRVGRWGDSAGPRVWSPPQGTAMAVPHLHVTALELPASGP